MPPRFPSSSEDAWQAVCNFAKLHERSKKPLYTLARFVPNRIVDVTDSRIERVSEEGRSQTAHITRAHVDRVWTELREQGWSSTKGHPRVFTHALMLYAMPSILAPWGPNAIRRRGFLPESTPTTPTLAAADAPYRGGRGRGGGGGEGPEHLALRMYVFEEPNAALAGLPGGPWCSMDTECVLETNDRIDVVLRDNDGNYALVEIKPRRDVYSDSEYRALSKSKLPAAIAPFAQAAKYRTQWHVLYGTPMARIRSIVAAPVVPRTTLARQMWGKHQIESVAVELPQERVPR